MSREQWGHGYYKGVEDALSGAITLTDYAPVAANFFICVLCGNGISKGNLEPVPFSDLIALGCDMELLKEVHDYILNNKPIGSYISGAINDKWHDDSIVLPATFSETKEYWDNKASYYFAEYTKLRDREMASE